MFDLLEQQKVAANAAQHFILGRFEVGYQRLSLKDSVPAYCGGVAPLGCTRNVLPRGNVEDLHSVDE